MAFSVGLDMAVSAGLFVAFSTEPKHHLISVTQQLLLAIQERVVNRHTGNLLYLIKGQLEAVRTVFPDPIP